MSIDPAKPVPASAKDLDRYVKLRAMMRDKAAPAPERAGAAKRMRALETKFPDIRARVEQEDRYKAAYDEVRASKFGGVPPASKVKPPRQAAPAGSNEPAPSWFDRLRNAAVRGLGKDPVVWAAEQVDRAVEQTARDLAERGEEYVASWAEEFQMIGLDSVIEDEVNVEVDELEFDDGETGFEFKVEVPRKLWDRICLEPDGAASFVRFLASVAAGEGEEEG